VLAATLTVGPDAVASHASAAALWGLPFAEQDALELDGRETHRMRSAFDEDRAAANDLVVAGWHVLRFTSSMTNEQAVSTVRSALAALAQRLVA
jgi:very-short-patch-repair endonuclease